MGVDWVGSLAPKDRAVRLGARGREWLAHLKEFSEDVVEVEFGEDCVVGFGKNGSLLTDLWSVCKNLLALFESLEALLLFTLKEVEVERVATEHRRHTEKGRSEDDFGVKQRNIFVLLENRKSENWIVINSPMMSGCSPPA